MSNDMENFKEGFFEANKQAGKTIAETHDAWDEYAAAIITKEHILNVTSDLVSDFLYYDRKEDEDLPMEAIEKSIAIGTVTVNEIVEHFRSELVKGI